MNTSIRVASVILTLTALTACGKPMTEDGPQNQVYEVGPNPYPGFRGTEVKGNSNFAELINQYAKGVPAKAGWAGDFWAYTANGIASGRNGGGQSPAGKYDAVRGHTGRDVEHWEVANHGAGVKGVQGWWGHCNGWCAASALFPEPREPVKVNGIEFSVADLKGLLSEAGMTASADFFGNRVDPWTREFQKAMDDTSPNQYFLVLTNFMGKLKQGVLLDRFTGDQIWNQPLAGYRFKYPTKNDYLGCSSGGVCKINLSSTIWWYNDSGVPAGVLTPPFEWDDVTNNDGEVIQHRDLELEVWVDAPIEFDDSGKIIKSGNVISTRDGTYFVGGAWKNGALDGADGHPDYMWVPYSLFKPDANAADPYGNPHVDIDWIKAHLLVPGGLDDHTTTPVPVASAMPTSSPNPNSPNPGSNPSQPSNPFPFPTHQPRPDPEGPSTPMPPSFPHIPGPQPPMTQPPSMPGPPSMPMPPSMPSVPGSGPGMGPGHGPAPAPHFPRP